MYVSVCTICMYTEFSLYMYLFVRFIVCIYGESKWNVEMEMKGHGIHESMV